MPEKNTTSFRMECQDYEFTNPRFDSGEHRYVTSARPVSPRGVCHASGGSRLRRNARLTRDILDVPVLPRTRTVIRTKTPTYECQGCGKVSRPDIPFLEPDTRISTRLAEWIRALAEVTSFRAVSVILGVGWGTAKEVVGRKVGRTLKERRLMQIAEGYRPRRLAVDEFAIHKGHRYATAVMDLDTGEVLWVGKGRSMKDFHVFFETFPAELLSGVEAVAMDMNASYSKVVTEMLPDAEIVYDRYHLEAQFSRDVMGRVRLDGLVAHASHPIGTGKLEGKNNRIKVLKRIAYGFRDDEFFFSLIRYMSIPNSHQNP